MNTSYVRVSYVRGFCGFDFMLYELSSELTREKTASSLPSLKMEHKTSDLFH